MSDHHENPRTTPEGVPIIEGPDGLSELDNPMPRWMTHIFWATVVFSLIYVAVYPGLGINTTGWTQQGQYEQEVAAAPKPAEGATKDLAAVAKDPAAIERGKVAYTAQCAACHGPDGSGAIGPKLSDQAWLYGGTMAAIEHTIAEGTTKGMPGFKASMTPTQIAELAAYVHSLGGGQ